MSRANRNHEEEVATTGWSTTQAYSMAIVCLLLGLCVGYLLRGSAPVAATPSQAAAVPQMPANMPPGQIPGFGNVPGAGPSPELADKAAQPLVEQLKSNPKDVALLTKLGNLYYDGQIYAKAIDYYEQALKLDPKNAGTRTDMATCIWYTGDADKALAEFEKSLKYQPNFPNALFNMGVVKWQGKKDVKGAIAAWEQLLKTNPNYHEKQKVQDLLDGAKQHGKA
jgi:cytochrome c-type biogenesis protein CcmH/NrfG